MGKGCSIGLRAAGLLLQRESQGLVPVDFGLLKASAYTRAVGSGWKTEVFVGYTAAYALRVHELTAMKLRGQPRPLPSHGSYWDPRGRGQAKFLEEPARRFQGTLNRVVRDAIQKANVP